MPPEQRINISNWKTSKRMSIFNCHVNPVSMKHFENHKNLPKIQISKPEYSIKLFDIEIIFFRQILVLDFDLHCFWTSKSKFFANRSII